MSDRAEQDAAYLEGAHEVLVTRLARHVDLHTMAADRLVHSLLDALAEAGWYLINAEDADKLIGAYVVQQVR